MINILTWLMPKLRNNNPSLTEARKVLKAAGYAVTTPKMAPKYLRDMGFDVATVFDVGVNKGTPGLYKSFPKAKIVLIDPRKESIDATKREFSRYKFISEVCAAGNNPGTASLTIPDRGGRSSIPERAPLTAGAISEIIEVPVKRIDDIVRERKLSGPFGLKIDTEGYEIEVMKGAEETLKEAQFVIAETSVKRRFVDGYRFSDLIVFMRDHGFELLDTMSYKRRPSAWIDCLFVRSDSPLFG